MHDIRLIRDNPAVFDEGLRKRGMEPLSQALVALDERRREAIGAAQAAQERRNALSKEIGQARGSGDESRAQALIAEVARLKDIAPELEALERAAVKELQTALASVPNTPLPDVPVGTDEHGNVERHRFGAPRDLPAASQHFEIGGALGLMDFETAARLSGSRFVVLRGQLARLERALGQFMLDLHTSEHGYTEVSPPLLVRSEAMFGTAQLPKFKDDQFAALKQMSELDRFAGAASEARVAFAQRLSRVGDARDALPVSELADLLDSFPTPDPLWLVPTAEVPLTNLVRESILSADELPLRFTALTPCFRAEAGAAGRDTRGMLRQHQFQKCELVSISAPEASGDEHERMLACAEEVLKRLDLPYRVMTLCTGDMGFAAAKTYDIEVWLPGQKAYREISSCSVCTEFQARRMDARYRPRDSKAARFVHTLNGSGIAVGRALIAVLENYQNADGSVALPSALAPYMGGVQRIEKAP